MFHYSMHSRLFYFSGLDIHWRKEDILYTTTTKYKKVLEVEGQEEPLPLE